MKNKKGFTLIELLAVIVILAIIALIATPIILNMINQARKSAAKSSSLGFVDAIEYYAGFSEARSTGMEISGYDVNLPSTSDFECTKGTNGWDNTCKTFMEAVETKSKGKNPDKAKVYLTGAGKVKANSKFYFNKYTCTYDGHDISGCVSGDHTDGSSNNNQQTTYTAYSVGQSINYNPVTNSSCDTPTSTTGTKEGCMKWYVISTSGTSDSTVDVILDHNTTATVAWVTQADYADDTNWSSNKNSKGPITANAQLATDTTGWTSGLNPRLITANEIAHIVGADSDSTIKWSSSKNYGTDDIENKSEWFYLDGGSNSDPTVYASGSNGWQKQVATSQGASNYKWLFDYTKGCTSYGCDTADSSTYGYWTSSPVSGRSSRAWSVARDGRLFNDIVDDDGTCGVRPVITISKSVFSS